MLLLEKEELEAIDHINIELVADKGSDGGVGGYRSLEERRFGQRDLKLVVLPAECVEMR